MSGSGRKTHYRKSVTEEFLNGLPVPEENEVICRNHSSRGTNIFEVKIYNTVKAVCVAIDIVSFE
jgi:hypothetical protein